MARAWRVQVRIYVAEGGGIGVGVWERSRMWGGVVVWRETSHTVYPGWREFLAVMRDGTPARVFVRGYRQQWSLKGWRS